MSLAARRSARRLENIVMRLGCLLVTAALLVSLVLEPPKAKAFVATSSAISSLCGGFLAACGLTPVVSGVEGSEGVAKSIDKMLREFLDTIGSPTPEEWLGQQLALTVTGGKIHIPKVVAAKLGQFAKWVAGKYGTKPGENVVYSDKVITFLDGSSFYASVFDKNSLISSPCYSSYSIGSFVSVFGDSYDTGNIYRVPNTGFSFSFYSHGSTSLFECYNADKYFGGSILHNNLSPFTFCVSADMDIFGVAYQKIYNDVVCLSVWSLGSFSPTVLSHLLSDMNLTLDVSETMQQILDRITALEEGQSIALDVGATQTMEIQEILQNILDKILVGDLTASAEVVDEAVKPVDPDPPAETLPDLDSLGLPALGAALTSRFPFSIPWDVYKGVKLLAAPAKAPYFEVDFMEPIAYRVGGWKGSTKIVLDFSEYEIIGQVCRWTSTIGFCLMLASGTKRLIWTA